MYVSRGEQQHDVNARGVEGRGRHCRRDAAGLGVGTVEATDLNEQCGRRGDGEAQPEETHRREHLLADVVEVECAKPLHVEGEADPEAIHVWTGMRLACLHGGG